MISSCATAWVEGKGGGGSLRGAGRGLDAYCTHAAGNRSTPQHADARWHWREPMDHSRIQCCHSSRMDFEASDDFEVGREVVRVGGREMVVHVRKLREEACESAQWSPTRRSTNRHRVHLWNEPAEALRRCCPQRIVRAQGSHALEQALRMITFHSTCERRPSKMDVHAAK